MVSYVRSRPGLYSSAYNFSEEEDGETAPTGLTNGDTGACTSTIIARHSGRKKVIESSDDGSANSSLLTRTFAASKTDGIVEFATTADQADSKMRFQLRKADETIICGVYLVNTGGGLKIYNQANTEVTPDSLPCNIYIHVAICFNNSGGLKDVGDGEDLADGQYRIYLSGVKIADYALTTAADADKFVMYSDVVIG